MQNKLLQRRLALTALVALATAAGSSLQAHDFRLGTLVIDHPYATPSNPGVNNGASYFRSIQNKGASADRLVAASTPIAERVELHEMKMDGNIMRMRVLSAIDLPAGEQVQLRHNQGAHLMLINLKRPLVVGDSFALRLTFEKAGETTVNVSVQQPRDAKSEQHKH